MYLFAITIKYKQYPYSSSYAYFTTKRYAKSTAQAIAYVTAMFNSLSNWYSEYDQPWFNVEEVGEVGSV